MYSLLNLIRTALLWCLVLLLPSCIEPYVPDAISSPESYLVVDGFINSQGSTTINLSRTYDVAAKTAPPAETKATVHIEEEGGMRYTLPESGTTGTYTSASLGLNPTKNYRLHILTSGGKEYASDYVPVKTTPPIDNMAWRATDAGLSIYVNTHDDTKASQYYRWEYEETWEIKSPYSPVVEYKDRQMQLISVPFPRTCWGNVKSTDIKISNTTRLSQDVVSDFLIRSFPTTANRLRYKYSILVKQYALTQEEYAYWELLRKNTENIGTLFDPLPAQLTGNIRCLNDETELALGFIGVHSITEKRIFVSREDLPATWHVFTGYESCSPADTISLTNSPYPEAQILYGIFNGPEYLPIAPLTANGIVYAYLAKSRDCIDCRKRGTDVRPSFWQ